jgi:ankyrin repeat protein
MTRYIITDRNEEYGTRYSSTYKFIDGLNIANPNDHSDRPDKCIFDSTTMDHIHDFYYFVFGFYLREVTLPVNEEKSKIIKKEDTLWCSNMIILGKRYVLADETTMMMMIERGLDHDFAIKTAARYGHLNVIKFLIAKGTIKSGNSALWYACDEGHFEIVKFLFENGTIKSDNENLFSSPLCCATDNGHFEIVKFLVENENYSFENINYAIVRAFIHHRSEIIKYLIDKADIPCLNVNDIIHHCSGNNIEIFKLLVERGMNIQLQIDRLLIIFSMHGNLELAKYLVDNGANIYTQNNAAIKNALKYNHYHLVEYFVENGAEINLEDWILQWKNNIFNKICTNYSK